MTARRARRRRWPLRLAVTLVALIAVLVGADLIARAVTESRLAAHVRSATGARSASVGIRSFPFVPPLLASGSISDLVVTAGDVPAGTMVLGHVTVDAHDVRLDRHVLLADHRIEVTSVARARVTLQITPGEISAAIGYPVTLSGGNSLNVQIGGTTVPATITVEGGHVFTVTAGGTRVAAIDLSSSPVVPNCQMNVDSSAGAVTVSCEVAPVPASVIDALSNRAASTP